MGEREDVQQNRTSTAQLYYARLVLRPRFAPLVSPRGAHSLQNRQDQNQHWPQYISKIYCLSAVDKGRVRSKCAQQQFSNIYTKCTNLKYAPCCLLQCLDLHAAAIGGTAPRQTECIIIKRDMVHLSPPCSKHRFQFVSLWCLHNTTLHCMHFFSGAIFLLCEMQILFAPTWYLSGCLSFSVLQRR